MAARTRNKPAETPRRRGRPRKNEVTTSAPRASARTSRITKTAKESVIEQSPATDTPKLKEKSMRRQPLFWLVVLIIIAGLLYLFRGMFIAAIVNGRPITRLSVVRELERSQGSEALENIITENLILQKAQEENVTVSDQEISDEVTELEGQLSSQGQNLDALLTAEGMSRDDLNDQIRLQKTVEKILTQDLVISDEEVQAYLEENVDAFEEDLSADELESRAKDALTQQQMAEKFNTWLEDLRTNANVQYFVNY